jgi:hypothetical protein
MAHSRKQILNSVDELEKQESILTNYLDDHKYQMPQLVRNIIQESIEDTRSAMEGLHHVLDEHYNAECTICKKVYPVEFPTLGLVCWECDKRITEKIQ